MKAVILAAGRGSRMGGLTAESPKCLVAYRGKSLLDWQLEALREAGVEEIGIATGYRREMLADRGLAEFHNPRWAETNMVSSLEAATDWLSSGPCIVSYSDIFYDAEAVRALIETDAPLAITYDTNWLELWKKRFGDPLLDAETFRLNGDGTLAEIGNKPSRVEDIEGQYMGLLRFTPESWTEVQRLRRTMPVGDRDRMHMTGTLQKIIQAGRIAIHTVPYDREWGEIDTAEDLASYSDAR
ncbi:phosphocholine cytidylyltransferase family protein [Breoghania sp. JC706]|uniref:phosphocholine cytidylyltransferase family protein n=1 Tax=Breoghania sp. JC706 TaxID=3117732 RepID=UPI003008E3EB